MAKVRLIARQLVRDPFPYTFPINFNSFQAGTSAGRGRIKLLG